MRTYENEPIVVQRDVKAVAIPAGAEVNLKLGSVGYITQALGGSFTVYIDGNLFRIAGHDADAIGKTAAKPPEVPPGASDEDIKNIIWQQLKTCYDPEIPVNIVDLGLVYECEVSKSEDALQLFDRVHRLLTDDAAASDELGKLAALSGVREYPTRVKCASLCWHTLASALKAADLKSLPAVSTE